MKQRSQSVAHGAVRAPQTRQRPIVGSSISARSSRTTPGRRGFLERGGALDRDAGDARVLQREPAEDRRLARRLLGLLEARRVETLRIEDPADDRLLRLVAGERRGERAEELARRPRRSAPA